MDIRVAPIRRQDHDTARKFAVEGMHLARYTANRLELYVFSKYFWYLELLKATSALGAYLDDRLVGVLLADMKGQPKVFHSVWRSLFVRAVSVIMDRWYQDANQPYYEANAAMLGAYLQEHTVDGELNFFAADPTLLGQGIGTCLLNALAQAEHGKRICLYSDSGATYQFYTHRGFEEAGRREITLYNQREVPLTCFLFSKVL